MGDLWGGAAVTPYPGHGKHYVGRPALVGQGLWGTAPGRAHRRQWDVEGRGTGWTDS